MMRGESSDALVITNGLILDATSVDGNPRAADILVDGARISAVLPPRTIPTPPGAIVVDATDRLITPGFFNGHYHSHDVFLKGCFEPSPLELWLLTQMPRYYAPRSLKEIRLRTLLGAAECIRNGITTVQDMLTLHPLDMDGVAAVVGAYHAAGVRVVLGLQVADVSPLETTPYWKDTVPAHMQHHLGGYRLSGRVIADPVEVIEECVKNFPPSNLLRWAIAPSSAERCTPNLLSRLRELAERYDLPVYSHIYISKAEALNARTNFRAYGGSLISFLEAMGMVNDRLALAHGVWLSDDEVNRLAAAGAHVVVNTISNLKNKNGAAPVRRFLSAGLNLALGCDNCSCTDAQTMLQAMKMTSLLCAISCPEPGPPDAIDMLRAATIGGARTARMHEEIGTIAPGMLADMILFNLADPAFVPLNNAARQLVYSEIGRGIESVVINGRLTMVDRVLRTVDERALRDEVGDAIMGFRADAARVMTIAEQLKPYVLAANRKTWEQDVGLDRYLNS